MLNTKDYNALDLAQPTNFNAMLRSGEVLWGIGCRIPHETAAQIVATLPHHFCFIDAEHSPLSPNLLVSLIKTIQYHSSGSMVPFVRIPASASSLINFVLNAGAGGIVRPHVQSAEQAAKFVSLCRFPPHRTRSYPPMALFGAQKKTREGESIYDVWDQNAAVFCQIEDLKGLQNIDEIVRVPGVNGIMVGVHDLRFSLGLSGGSVDGEEPLFVQALEKIQKAADRAGLPILGFTYSDAILRKRIELGWRALIVDTDVLEIYNGGCDLLKRCRDVAAPLVEEMGNRAINGNGHGGVNGKGNGVVNGKGNGVHVQEPNGKRMHVKELNGNGIHVNRNGVLAGEANGKWLRN